MNATTRQSNLAHFLSESHLVCVEIGLAELAVAAGHDVSQIQTSEITDVTVKAFLNRPHHLIDILLVSSWMFAESLCIEAQLDIVRSHWLTIAQGLEDSLS